MCPQVLLALVSMVTVARPGNPLISPHLDPPEIANKLGMRGSWPSVIGGVERRIMRNIMDESPVQTSPGGSKGGRNPKPKFRRKDNPIALVIFSQHTLLSIIACSFPQSVTIHDIPLK